MILGKVNAWIGNKLNPEWPTSNTPAYRVCDSCGQAVKFGERWRVGVSMPDTPTKTLCDDCEGEASKQ